MIHAQLRNLCMFSLLSVPASWAAAQSMPPMADMPGMQHHHHHEEAAAGSEHLGDVHFPISCAAAEKAPFELGIAMLHSFGYTKADAQFDAIAEADPNCAMAHWGAAMAQYRVLWGRPSAEDITAGAAQMQKARDIAARTHPSARELAYIHALSDFYTLAPQDFQKAADTYAADMHALHQAFPEDVEGAAFYALALIGSVAPDDTSLTKEHKALAVLLPLFKLHPEHPGLAHYIIHTCDTPALAQDGLQAAEVYARIAPSSPHALHMPGHIFARLGMWPEDISSNLASVAASQQDERIHQPGTAHQMHADEFLIYAYLQTGQDAKAKQLTGSMEALGKHVASLPGPDDMKYDGDYFCNELNAIYLMEMHDWKALAKLEPVAGSDAFSTFDVYWGNSVAAGHLDNAKLAAAALARLDQQIDAVRKTPAAYALNDVMVKRNEMLGWQELIAGHPDAAVAAMRKAAEQQDKLGQGEVDIPADEMEADLLMQLHRPEAALAEYKIALKLSPNRLNGLLGAGAASEALGQTTQAAAFYAQVAHNTSDGKDTHRSSVEHAVKFTSTTQPLHTLPSATNALPHQP
jgi:tetratricopeptide (TPR) repeat protein